ncbi:hypothetical protein DUI87_07688 [Hirundo rustica rustica]|uniref:Uncharacterized protein n=1 Tax=Hirundo rustica rustica TaxID=333673 RepID=A0A3M0KQY2_HIRRU|nr:hypothetical protein DUI87_07688 [Hirundo rustica rustica]
MSGMLECCVQFWDLQCKRDMELLESNGEQQGRLGRLQYLSYKERQRQLGLFCHKKRQVRGDLISVYNCLKGRCQEDVARLFSVVASNRIQGNGQKLMNTVFHLNMRTNFFTVRVTMYWNRLPREVVESLSLQIVKNHLGAILCYVLEG